MSLLLHVGCGHERGVPVAQFQDWEQIRVDIDPTVGPDVVDDIRELSQFGNESADAVYSSHNLEHLSELEVPLALSSFCRVLRPGGIAFIMVPDFRLACEWVSKGKGEDVIYNSPAGPITPVDMIFGYRPWSANEWQRHRTGFTVSSLRTRMFSAGFRRVSVTEGQGFDIIGVGDK